MMVIAYGCGKGRIHRNVQPPYEPPEEKSKVPESRKCPRCGVVKGADEFPRNVSSRNGLGTYCKECEAERRKERKRRAQP